MKRVEGKIKKRGKQGGAILYIQSGMISDERFPFKAGEIVQMTIVDDTVVISHKSLGNKEAEI